MKKLFIFGGSSTALEIFEVVRKSYINEFKYIYFVIGDNENKKSEKYIFDKELKDYIDRDSVYIISFSNIKLREIILNRVTKLNISPINIICSTAVIFHSAKLGVGNFINSNCIVSSEAVMGNHNIMNFSSLIGHNTIIGDHNILNPGAKVSANCMLGDRILIGSNSVIKQNIKIGKNTMIDALTFIDRDIDENKMCTSRRLNVFNRIELKQS